MLRNGNSFWSAMPPVTKNLIIINVIIWIAMIVLPASTTGENTRYRRLHYWKGQRLPCGPVVYIHVYA